MRFWDSSAVVSLLLNEGDSAGRERDFAEDPEMLVWYGTLAEIESAMSRKMREKSLREVDWEATKARLEHLQHRWYEVQAFSIVRERAIRLLRLHPLRAADAFQLAAALVAFSERTRHHWFYTGDERLLAAARAEGFQAR